MFILMWNSVLICVLHKGLVKDVAADELQFKPARCVQAATGVQCNDIVTEKELTVSNWPSGSYYLPMPVTGCPETAKQGWREGFISVTWKTPHHVYRMNQSIAMTTNDTNTFDTSEISTVEMIDVTSNNWPGFPTVVRGPFRAYTFRLNFCHRLQIGIPPVRQWPDGTYSVYGGTQGCPEGFASYHSTVHLGEIKYWTSEGYLPEFIMEEVNGTVTLRLSLCSRSGDLTNSLEEKQRFPDSDSSFMFVKDEMADCPDFENVTLKEETLYMDRRLDHISSELIHVQSYCFYTPHHWESDSIDALFGHIKDNAYIISTSQLMEGNHAIFKTFSIEDSEDILSSVKGLYRQKFYVPWKLVDLGRTMSVTAVRMLFAEGIEEHFEKSDIPTCHISTEKWCFLHFCSLTCTFKIYFEDRQTLWLLFLRPMDGRYIALTADKSTSKTLDVSANVDVFTDGLHYDGTSDCNSDLGMTDGGILDFQISASSFQEQFPPSSGRPYNSGWCASSSDTHPYIQVDLLVSTVIEGVTVWNWQQVVTSADDTVWDTVVHFGADILKIYLGNSSTSLTEYNKGFYFDKTRPFGESQTFRIFRPFMARLIRLEILKPATAGLSCLRFELQGCRVAGIPSLNCPKKGRMFQLSNAPVTPRGPIGEYNAVSLSECEDLCQHDANCSVASLQEKTSCLIYGHSLDENYHFHQNSNFETWSTKLCFDDQFTTTPTLTQMIGGEMSRGNVIHLKNETAITSPGYPFVYSSGQTFTWIVSFEKSNYVKLIFTNISLQMFEDNPETSNACTDSILISKDIMPTGEAARIIDYRFNGPLSVIETSESQIVITFVTCLPTNGRKGDGHGFRAIVAKQSLPSCFTLESPSSWESGRDEICSQSRMVLTSMSLLGMPFYGTLETWKIAIHGKRIHLVFEEFQVTCTDDTNSEFSITDLGVRNTYCNLNMPPKDIYSSSDNVLVSFYKDVDPPIVTFQEGFRLVFYSEEVSMDNLISYQYPRSELINVALGKPAYMSSVYIYQYPEFLSAGKGTDGTVHLDAAFGACFHTKDESEPWWIADLQGIYIIDRLVIYNKQENSAGVLARNIEIAVGTELSNLQVTGFLFESIIFRKTVDQHNIPGRFVKLTVKLLFQKFHLCEVEVYGVLESGISEKAKRSFTRPKHVQRTWGSWGPWSHICHCHGVQPRTRICEDPPTLFGWSACSGYSIDFRSCSPNANCNVTNVVRGKRTYLSSVKYPWSNADRATDGSTVSLRQACFQTKFEYQPWWEADLEHVYFLERLVAYTRTDCCNGRTRNPMISVRTRSCEWTVAYYREGERWGATKSINLIGHVARFVKIQLLGIYQYLNLCEIEIYGQLAEVGTSESSSMNCSSYDTVDGQYGTWSQWGDCSEKCGIGKRTRTRKCDHPAPSKGGLPCYGDAIDIENCVGKSDCPICSEYFGKCYSLFPELTSWNDAGYECWRRGMKLVKIGSQKELQFIKYLLRENRYRDKLPMSTFENIYTNASYLVHIGLYRYPVSTTVKYDMWEDRTPVTFSAWKSGEPSKGNCVRMNYKSFDDIKTWESEDCDTSLAEYFVCEQPIKNFSSIIAEKEMPERHGNDWTLVPEQLPAGIYTGTANTTKSGHTCMPWLIEGNNPYSIVWWNAYITRWALTETKIEAKNYCRDPGREAFVWCNYQTANNVTKREECNVRYPVIENTQNFDWKYVGKWNKTYSGKTCQSWDTTFPHGQRSTGFYFPGETIKSVKNYCRDPWKTGYLWCYTTNQNTRWEPCIIEDNPDDRCLTTHNVYSGNWNTTFSGKQCLRWNESHSVQGGINADMFPDHSLSAAGVFCRDPFGNGYLWCYVDGSDGSWEPCLVYDTDSQPPTAAMFNQANMFTCANGEEILEKNFCDERFHCSDLSDETDCLQFYQKHKLTERMASISSNYSEVYENFVYSSYFQCNTNEWISVTARCDGVKDCLDASDEFNCSWSLQGISRCSEDQFTCSNGDCIHISQVCNFVDDCVDRSDEYCDRDECAKTEYQCNNGQCISKEKRCNVIVDCEDGSDEDPCDFCQMDVAFHCDIVRCIPNRLVCDQYKDCADGSDEISCSQSEFASCEQWWEAGYRKSGSYIIGGLVVDCDFDSVIREKKMYTIIRNFDILWRDGDEVGYLYSRDTFLEEDSRLFEVIKRPNYRCVQEITQMCIPSHQFATKFDDPQHENSFRHCKCITMTIVVGKKSEVSYCNNNASGIVNSDELIFSYNGSLSLYRKVILRSKHDYVSQGYQLIPGPVFCEYEYDSNLDIITCEGDVKVIPNSLNCLYDLDSAGNALGCRSGSHLQNCEHFECHEGTVKCPGSYCIPLRFVCDGEVQCPGGNDEQGCECEADDNELLILYDTESVLLQELDVYSFARQFSTSTNIVRILGFVATQPLQGFKLDDVIIQVTDNVIQPMSAINREQECKYNLMAKNFVKDTRLHANNSAGIIYIGDQSENSNRNFKSFFEGVVPGDLNLTIYRVMEKGTTDTDIDSIPEVEDVMIKRWQLLNTIGAGYFPEFCSVRSKVDCYGKYKCKWSKMCLPMNQVCDGERQCFHGDDEQLCDFKCPFNCTCVGYSANCSDMDFSLISISPLPVSTRKLDLSLNKGLKDIMKSSYFNMMVLVTLNLSSCSIDTVSRFAFLKIRNLVHLDLSYNDISVIRKGVFSYLGHIRTLRLDGNGKLSLIQPGAFESLSKIKALNFAGARLTKISAHTFSGLILQTLDVSNNSIKEIEDFAFNELSVNIINFDYNDITLFNKEIFTGVNALQSLKTPAFKFCCIKPNYVPEEGCYPPKDEFSSCEDLMRLSALQTMLWLIGLSALFGNALTIMYRIMYDRERLRLGFGIFVTNLAAADFLMGVYLLIIAIADAAFRKRYIFMDDYWRNSMWCNLAGVLSTVSSEASVFFLCLITIDRVLVIKFPFGQNRFNKKRAIICASVVWILSIFFAILPLAYESYFKNKFYTKSGVCIALPLTRDRPPGWVYSVVIFVGLNFATFVLVAFGQWSIFIEIKRASSGLTKTTAGRKNDLKVARNLLLVVLTDFLCWFPIGVMGMMALNGHVISGDVYAWSAVFILPINSALNPILYTVSSIIGRKTFNPSTDEQSRSEITKELGTQFLNFQRVSRHFSVRTKASAFKSINSLLINDRRLEPVIALKIVMQLVKCLDVLHGGSLVLGDINTATISVSVSKYKLIGDVRIESEPSLAKTTEAAPDDMLNVGKVVRVLLSKCQQRNK